MQSCSLISGSFANWFKLLFGKREESVFMISVVSAGKTTILYQLKRCEFVQTHTTSCLNVEIIERRGINLKIWDIGWGERIGPLWRHHFHETNSQAFIFVVDSSDRETIDESREKLADAVSMTSNSVIVLVFANKQDVADAMSVIEITDKLQLPRLPNRVKWHIQASCAVTGEGLREGIDWLELQLKIKETSR